MIKLLKRFWAFLFGTSSSVAPEKNLTERAIELLEQQKALTCTDDKPMKVDLSEKKGLGGIFKRKVREVSMKNNRLHIQYNGASGANGHNVAKRKFQNGLIDWFVGSMYKDRIDSIRCTKLSRAEEIVGQIQKYCIERAVFKDAAGNEFKLI